jgi:hypothetical protein
MQQTWAVSQQGNKATFEHRNCGRFSKTNWMNWDVSQLANYGHVMTKIMCMSSEVSSLHPAGLIIWQYRSGVNSWVLRWTCVCGAGLVD